MSYDHADDALWLSGYSDRACDEREEPIMSAGLKPCPFCGSTDVDPAGWMCGDGTTGPACYVCGGSAESVDRWNTRTSPASANGTQDLNQQDAPANASRDAQDGGYDLMKLA